MELTIELLILLARILTIIPLMLFITLKMGRRSIAELPVFDFLIIITLGAVVGADLADPSVGHIHTAVAVVLIGLLQITVTYFKLNKRSFGRLITFGPTIVIHNGQFLEGNLTNIRYSIDNVLMMLREKDIFSIEEVEVAIIEASGNLSVHKKPEKMPLTREDTNYPTPKSNLAFPLILDGKLHQEVLSHVKVSEQWLEEQLALLGINEVDSIFFASINDHKELHVSLRENQLSLFEDTPPIYH
ncbi:DUF421 domain-containing protein [Bacillus sp. FJAT-45037]|uniref:DUF421 domain-containing protein n=1 Tax=Bacillus sp. FJAT-45037 TaxID=2011007 RepID=UPI000C233CBB|nr:DUF421 domain-containing protein [Bacillus sp. FJAT-45037]